MTLELFGAIGGCSAARAWQHDVIKHGAGEYNATTGKFQWKETDSDDNSKQ